MWRPWLHDQFKFAAHIWYGYCRLHLRRGEHRLAAPGRQVILSTRGRTSSCSSISPCNSDYKGENSGLHLQVPRYCYARQLHLLLKICLRRLKLLALWACFKVLAKVCYTGPGECTATSFCQVKKSRLLHNDTNVGMREGGTNFNNLL